MDQNGTNLNISKEEKAVELESESGLNGALNTSSLETNNGNNNGNNNNNNGDVKANQVEGVVSNSTSSHFTDNEVIDFDKGEAVRDDKKKAFKFENRTLTLNYGELAIGLVAICCLMVILTFATVSLSSGKNRVIINQVARSTSAVASDDSTDVKVETVDSTSASKGEKMTMEQLYKRVVESCVGISISSSTKNYWGYVSSIAVAGSGFILTEDGYIVTNYHVIEDAASSASEASDIMVKTYDGEEHKAIIIGGEKERDVAILKIEATGLKPVVLGDSSELQVGQEVATIGNPLGELDFSLTNGIVSALDRIITTGTSGYGQLEMTLNMLQTNCVINSGNSGGPLFNVYGEVIGITTAKYSSGGYAQSASIEGLGFAIPINDVSRIISDIIAYGYVKGKPYLGISIESVSAEAQRYGVSAGAYVSEVKEGSCSDKAGIKVGDIIIALGDKTIDSGSALKTALISYLAGDTTTIKVIREGSELEFEITFDERESSEETNTTQIPAYNNQTITPGFYDWPFGGLFN